MNDLLSVRDLSVTYRGRSIFTKPKEVLHSVSIDIAPGETLGLVGESGSGKTTLGRAVLGLVKPSAGTIEFEGEHLRTHGGRRSAELARAMQVVFQDPYTSLNPALTIDEILSEPLVAQGRSRADARSRVADLLEEVNLPKTALRRFPNEFSGGQRQRVAIARALALDPRLVVCDEPVSALDLTNQVRVLDLLIEIQERTGVAYMFISHDLAVVRRICHRIAVMYGGGIVESGSAEQVTSSPVDPYTQRLLLAAPVIDPDAQRERRAHRKSLLSA